MDCTSAKLFNLYREHPANFVGMFFLFRKLHNKSFFAIAKGLEHLPEGGERCHRCYSLRLEDTARLAADGGYDYFTTTLSISPHKNAEWLNTIGEEMAKKYGSSYLYSDFKKRGGYLRSCQLAEKHGLYRQDFCGCIYSKLERDKRLKEEHS